MDDVWEVVLDGWWVFWVKRRIFFKVLIYIGLAYYDISD